MLEDDIKNTFGRRAKPIAEFSLTPGADLPAELPSCYMRPLEEADPDAAEDGLCGGDALLDAENNYRFLAKLRTKALRVLGETLDVRTPSEDDGDYARVLAIKKDAAVNIVSASLKADENCFRQRHNDALDRLYNAVEAELVNRAAAPLTIEN